MTHEPTRDDRPETNASFTLEDRTSTCLIYRRGWKSRHNETDREDGRNLNEHREEEWDKKSTVEVSYSSYDPDGIDLKLYASDERMVDDPEFSVYVNQAVFISRKDTERLRDALTFMLSLVPPK